jgi:hypothetical protein
MTHTTVRPRNAEEDFPFNWLGLPASRKTLSLFDAAQTIPAFVKRPFQAAPDVPRAIVNPYYEVIVRLPTDEDPAEVPVGLVSRNYQLVQHHEVLQRAAGMLASFGIDLNEVEVNLCLTIHGERMALGLVFPRDSEYTFAVSKGDIMAMYLEFINSVDGTLRLTLRVSWLRLVCTNGLTVREVLWDYSRLHVGTEILNEFEDYLPAAVNSVATYKALFQQWMKTTVTDEAFDNWIETTVRQTWGLKAAVQAYHIARRCVDVHIEKMRRRVPVTKIPVSDKGRVTGALVGSLNIFAISQMLTWLAGDRGEFQEQLNWKIQVFEMLKKLVPKSSQSELFESPGVGVVMVH